MTEHGTDRDALLSRKREWEKEFWRQENIRRGRDPNDPRISTPDWLHCTCGMVDQRRYERTTHLLFFVALAFVFGVLCGGVIAKTTPKASPLARAETRGGR